MTDAPHPNGTLLPEVEAPLPLGGRGNPGRWRLLVALALGVAVSNGFARFAYGLILPAMRTDLGWTYADAGWLNTANAIGYLVGSLLTLALLRRVSAERLFFWGLAGTGVALLASGATESFAALTAFRVIAGVTGAPAFIAGGALAARLFPGDPRRAPLAIAVYFGGGGVGMVLSGAALPWLFAVAGPGAWPTAWTLLGVASLAAAILAGRAASWSGWAHGAPPRHGATAQPPVRAMIPELAGYTFFGLGYIVYITFFVAFMRELAAGPVLVSTAWVVMGVGVMVSPFAWRRILERSDGGLALALTTGATAAGTLLAVSAPGTAGLIASAAVFGISIFMAPGSVTAFSRRNLAPEAVPGAVALFTTLFAAGQIVGPFAAGAIADASGSVSAGLFAAGIILAAGALIAAFQRPLTGRG